MTVYVITEMATKWQAGSEYSMDILDKAIVHGPPDGMKCHNTTQKGTQFKTYELLVLKFFILYFGL